jgi:hypothetical protein
VEPRKKFSDVKNPAVRYAHLVDQGTNPRKIKKGWNRGSVAPINFMSNTARETEDQVQQILNEEINRAFDAL